MVDQAQDTLRPNNRLSDMQATMEQTQAFENRVLERLNAGKTVRSFLITAVELLTEAVNLLVLQVFRKDDYAVKYAVEPLLDGDGPLGDLSVRLKLIYGLGVINRQEYEDAELLMALREELNHDGNEYAFTDDSFSALDFKTDAALRHALQDETRDAAVLIIAQRISTILHADQIVVLKDGEVVGLGTHGELMETCEVYRAIAESQMKGGE